MDGTSLVCIPAPIVIPICLFTGIALPCIADSYAGAGRARLRHRRAGEIAC